MSVYELGTVLLIGVLIGLPLGMLVRRSSGPRSRSKTGRSAEIRAEAARLGADPADREEARRIMEDLREASSAGTRPLGTARGRFTVPPDFDSPLELDRPE